MDNQPYSTAEILAYLRGDMPLADRHRLEKAALDDELLADALEGFGKMRERYSDEFILAKAENLATKANPVNETTTKVVSIPARRVNWQRFMAAAVVVGILAIAINRFTGKEIPSKTEAQEEVATIKATPEVNLLQDSNLPAPTDIAVAPTTVAPYPEPKTEAKKKTPETPAKVAPKTPPAVKEGSPEQGNLASVESVSSQEGYMADKSVASKTMTQPRTLAPAAGYRQKGLTASIDTSVCQPNMNWQDFIIGLQRIKLPEGTQLTFNIDENGSVSEWNIAPFVAEKDKARLQKLLKSTEPWKVPNKKSAQLVWVW